MHHTLSHFISCHAISQVADPWGGSYMMEALTDELEKKAMEIINEVEAAGGMTKAIMSGMPKRRIEECSARKQVGVPEGAARCWNLQLSTTPSNTDLAFQRRVGLRVQQPG